MARKIYLEGELGYKFGKEHLFQGDSVRDAIRLLEANNPEFKSYLLEAVQADIGFTVAVGNNSLEDARECLLPLKEGDILITPVPAGSKSGGGKILAAIALFALSAGFSAVAYGQQIAMLSGAGSTSLMSAATLGAKIATTLAVNLALTGIQQLMAPDPAVDQQDEGYLFNGSEQNIVEGMPIPLLYGELRVPGYPVSFEIIHGSKTVTSADQYVDAYGNIISNTWESEALAYSEELSYLNSSSYSSFGLEATALNSASTSGTQDILFTDIISEGPIYGLVDGGNSVYLNDDPAQLSAQAVTRVSQTPVDFIFTNASTSVTIDKNGYTKNIEADLANGAAYLVVRNYQSSAGTAVEATTSGTAKAIEITTSTSIFSAGYVYARGSNTATVIIRLVEASGTTIFEGYVDSYTSGTQVTCIPLQGADINPAFSGGSYTVVVDGKLAIAAIAPDQTSLTLAAPFPVTSGTYKCDLAGTTYETLALEDRIALGAKYRSYAIQFRTGSLTQPAFADAAGTGVGTIALGPGASFTPGAPALYAEEGETDNPTVEYTGTAAGGFGLTAAQAEEVDEIRVTFTYPQLWNRSEMGSQKRATVRYNASIAISKDGATFGAFLPLQSRWEHVDKKNAASIWEEVVDLRPYQPFKDFKIQITRTTFNDRAYNEGTNTFNTAYSTASDVQISSLNSIIKENLSYPLTAMAKVRVNSKEFSSVPSRTYHCKGLRVLVPSNYITRDEGENGVATYNRNVTTAAITSSHQDWDGAFRAEKVYTNNPAWVFYDILTNDRYGLGNWVQSTEIDKYALYRIARYCDELVPNGNGGLEPRFTTNVYLTRATDAYKVLKDLATVFRGMLYWVDGQMYTTIDQPSDPVYNFSKGNVLDGAFSYESTGSKTRANQVVVSWNNPAANYKLENLIVEDRQNIVKTGRIITEEAVAFGATTEGQALRYGRWKLWTAVNQTEIISFKTAVNAAFLAPGDIINVQDADRYPGHVKYSGRVSNTGTRTTTVVPLDREITLNSGSDYELSVVTSGDVATLAQDTATIASTVYYRGDILPSATDIVDDSGNYVDIVYKPYTNVETRSVSTSAGAGITSLTVSSAFSEIPATETIWALRESVSGVDAFGSKKMYKILSLSEEGKNEYAITAVEFYNEKYDAVDNSFTLSVQDPVYRPPLAGEVVPPPTNVYVYVSDLNSGEVENDAVIYWDAPVVSGSDLSSEYQYVDYYELELNLPNLPETVRVGKNQRSASGIDLPVGTHTVGIRTVAMNGQKSAIVKATFTIEDPARQAVPRKFGLALGAISSSPAFITSAGVFTFENKSYSITPVGDPTVVVSFDGDPITEYTQDCSGMSNVDYSALSTQEEKLMAAHFVMLDSQSADPLKLIRYYKDELLGYGYFYDTGTGASTPSSNWTSIGTVSVAVNSNKVVGTGTTFTSSLRVGDLIKFSSSQAAKVIYIASNTDVRIDRSFTSAISGVSASRSSFRFDKNEDAIIAQIRKISGVFYYYPVNLAINPDLGKEPRSVLLNVAPTFFNFDGSEVLTTTYTNLVLTATAFGYKNPEFKVTGAGFDNAEISQTAETVFSPATSGFNYTKTLDKVDAYSTTDLVFTVEVRDALDPDNVEKQTSSTITVPFVKDGAAGSDGKLVRLTSNDYSVVYDNTGANPSPSGTLTFTATASNFTDPYFKFTGDGITDEVSYTDGTGDTDTFSFSIPANTISWAGNPLSIRVGVAEAAEPAIEVAFDTISIFYVADGVDGDDGIDGYTVIITNSAHSFTADSAGTVATYEGSGTSIEVYKGGAQLDSVSSAPTAGEFSVSVSASGITAGTPSVTGLPYVIGDHSSMAGDTALITYTLDLEGAATGTQKQTFTKSKAGTNGTDGTDGATGDTGPRNAQVYFYYNTPQASAPSAPSTAQVSYNFSTQAPSISASGWSTTFNPAALSSSNTASNKFWAVRVIFQETSFGGSYSETISSVFPWMNFDGLVTFTNLATGRDENGNLSTTLIDGGAIIADSLKVGSIESNTSKTYGNFQFEMGTTTSVAGYQGAGIFRAAASSGFGIGGLGNALNNFSVAGQQAYNDSTSYAGAFLNSTILGGSTHRTIVFLANNTRAGYFQASTRAVNLCNATYAVQTTGDVYVDGDITATGTISPFTGSHDGVLDIGISLVLGDIMIDSEILVKKDISNTLSLVAPSSAEGQPAIGVYAGDRDTTYVSTCISGLGEAIYTSPGVAEYPIVIAEEYLPLLVGRKLVSVNALGEGQINVCGEGGDIAVGDLIITSSLLGKGKRQADDIVRGKTVAKAREAVTFTSTTEVKQIACIYLCG